MSYVDSSYCLVPERTFFRLRYCSFKYIFVLYGNTLFWCQWVVLHGMNNAEIRKLQQTIDFLPVFRSCVIWHNRILKIADLLEPQFICIYRSIQGILYRSVHFQPYFDSVELGSYKQLLKPCLQTTDQCQEVFDVMAQKLS